MLDYFDFTEYNNFALSSPVHPGKQRTRKEAKGGAEAGSPPSLPPSGVLLTKRAALQSPMLVS